MHEPSQLLVILSVICLCAFVAHRLSIAAPLVFLLGGTVLALVPSMSHITIDPEYMLVIFLPPILMEAAFYTSIRDFRAGLVPILRLAVGLVILSALASAWTLSAIIPGITLTVGLVLGAIISPPDAAAATSALKNVVLPKRVLTILEGESLVNDATGIVLYNFAVAAVMAGSFSMVDASLDFAWKTVGGIAVGWATAWVFVRIYPMFRDPSVSLIATFMPPYAAYILAEQVHGSGVLAVVAAGLYLGWHAPTLFDSRSRQPMESVWKLTVFFLSALAFLLIGLQLPTLVYNLRAYDTTLVVTSTVGVCLASLAVRFLYVFVLTYTPYWVSPRCRKDVVMPAWQNVLIVGWTSMRGVVTLALALALPLTLPNGEAFPYRDLLIFISISMILFTLVLQGLTLPWMVRKLNLRYDNYRLQEEWLARVNATRTALTVLEKITDCADVHRPALERIRQHYQERLDALGDGPNTPIHPGHQQSLLHHPQLLAENRIWLEALTSERETVIELRKQFSIGDDVMHEILRELDLLSSRFYYDRDKAEKQDKVRRRFWKRARKLEEQSA